MSKIHALIMLFSLVFPACGGSTTGGGPTTDQDSGSPTDDTAVSDDAGDETAADTITPPGDATVRRLPCLPSTKLSGDLPLDQYGALEGELVSIVPPGSHGCPEDADHLHLQIDVGGKRYDVAVTVNDTTGGQPMQIFEKDLAPTTAPQGWSGAGFDFVTNLGAHAASFSPLAEAPLLSKLEGELANVSSISVHGKSYTDGTGVHDVHRNGGGHDGVLLMRGVGAGGMDHAFALHFYNDVF
jgi:hypothetical protein